MFGCDTINRKNLIMCETFSHIAGRLYLFLAAPVLLLSANTFADSSTQTYQNLCPVKSSVRANYHIPRAFTEEEIHNIEISADTTRTSTDGSTSLDGNVVIEV